MSEVRRGDIFWINLEPALGSETKKTRPCIIISNNAQNKKSKRVIMVPITSQIKLVYPFEVKLRVNNKEGKAMLDQIRAVDKQRLGAKISSADTYTMLEINEKLKLVLSLA